MLIVWVEGGVGILKNDLDAFPVLEHVRLGEADQFLAVILDGTRVWLLKAEDGPTKRGLSTSGLPDQAESPSFGDVEIDLVHRLDRLAGFAEKTSSRMEVYADPFYFEKKLGRDLVAQGCRKMVFSSGETFEAPGVR